MVINPRTRRAAEYDLCALRAHYACTWLLGQETVAPGFSLIEVTGPYLAHTNLLPGDLNGYSETLLSDVTGMYYRVDLIADGDKPLAVSSVDRLEGK